MWWCSSLCGSRWCYWYSYEDKSPYTCLGNPPHWTPLIDSSVRQKKLEHFQNTPLRNINVFPFTNGSFFQYYNKFKTIEWTSFCQNTNRKDLFAGTLQIKIYISVKQWFKYIQFFICSLKSPKEGIQKNFNSKFDTEGCRSMFPEK